MLSLLYVAAAMVAGLLLSRLAKLIHLPNVTGYLIAGLLIGPNCLRLLPRDALASLHIVTTAALGFIAFSIGGEFKLSNIRAIGVRTIIITLFQAMTAVILVDAALLLCGFPAPLSLTLGAIAAATAPAATLMVVRQYRAKGELTNTLLPVVAMDDAIGLMVFSISIAVAGAIASGESATVGQMVGKPLLEIVLSLLVGAAIGTAAALSMRLFHSKANRLSICIACVLLGVSLAKLWNLSDLLLCMSIGAMLVNLRDDAMQMLDGAEAWTPPLFMLFFVISGAELDIPVLLTVGALGFIYLVARSIGKYFGAWLGATIVKAPEKIRKYLGITLLPQAGVAIGMAQLAMTALPEYGQQIQAVVLSATLIYELAGPMATKLALQKAGEIESTKPEKPKPPKAVKPPKAPKPGKTNKRPAKIS